MNFKNKSVTKFIFKIDQILMRVIEKSLGVNGYWKFLDYDAKNNKKCQNFENSVSRFWVFISM